MTFWAIVLVVLLIIWLFGGFNSVEGQNYRVFVTNSLIPWACVAILTYLVVGNSTGIR